MTYIRTNSGLKIDFADIESSKINIEDIAHALSHVCRFAGQSRHFYSVAEHSVRVANAVERKYMGLIERTALRELARWALMHDAAEAYMCDIPAPLKNMPCMEGYRELEKQLQNKILKTCGLSGDMPHEVKEMDRAILTNEAACLMPASKWKEFGAELLPSNVMSPFDSTLGQSPTLAKRMFMDKFRELGGIK